MADRKEDLQKKLRRLGVVRGTGQLKPPRKLKPASPVDDELLRPFTPPKSPNFPDDDDIQPLETLLPGGEIVSTAHAIAR